jgi:Tn3 transposase DDE domain
VLADTEQLLSWTRFFGPLSGHEAKLDNPRELYLMAAFCYGCNLGPSQTARWLKGADRRQIAWVNQRHISEGTLDQAVTARSNAYNQFHLLKLWGSGKHASADGTKWELYEPNLLSEYHIRYGGYGGISPSCSAGDNGESLPCLTNISRPMSSPFFPSPLAQARPAELVRPAKKPLPKQGVGTARRSDRRLLAKTTYQQRVYRLSSHC